jgi:protein-tyrosine kinase
VSIVEEAIRRLKQKSPEAVSLRREPAVAQARRADRADPDAAPPSSTNAYRGRPLKLDESALRANGLLIAGEHALKLTDEFRVIKRPLLKLANATGPERIQRGNGVMVTSSAPGEGKTFIALNLAQALATEQDHEVILLDADFKKQELTRLCGLDGAPGLLDVLANEAELTNVVHPTDQPRFSIVPAGTYRDNANELLASQLAHERVGRCLDDPRRILVFDTAPILYSSEPQAIAGLVGQIVFVVRAGVTLKRGFTQALEKLGTAQPRNIVLNDADSVLFGRGSSHLYGYYGSPQHMERPARAN